MTTAWHTHITDAKVDEWIDRIDRAASKVGRPDPEHRVKDNLRKMDAVTVFYVHHAFLNSTSEQLTSGLKTSIMMNAEEMLKQQAVFWEVFEVAMSMSVNKSMVFKYVNAPIEDNLHVDELLPYVAKAHALCALASVFWLVTGNVNRVREIEQDYPEYVELFEENAEHAVELAKLMGYGKAHRVEDLKYRLGLHPSVAEGAL